MSKSTTQSAGIEFQGKKAEKQLAEQVFGLFRASGQFYAANAPIRLPVASLIDALASMGNEKTPKALQAALNANDHIWIKEEGDEDVIYVTTKNGVPPVADGDSADTHTLAQRFATPEPPRERPQPRGQDFTIDTLAESQAESAATGMEFPPDSWQAAVAAALREAGQPRGDVVMTDSVVETESPGFAEDVVDEVDVVVETPTEEVTVTELEEGEVLDEPVDSEIIEEAPASVRPAADATPATATPEAVTYDVVDTSTASDEELADAIEVALRDEPAAVRWGDAWMHESNVPKLSKDDLSKIQEFLAAASEAVSDYALMRELHSGQTPGSEEFELDRFGLNYRMSRETRLFEFVGTARQALWTTAGQPTISSEKRKASEIGQDYRFLLDYRTPDAELEPGLVEHVLTFYEHYYGVLPYNANFATIMPKAAFNDQRATRLTFESPQTFETFEIELRYPTSNRGGYLIGFEKFFAENLVPGAVVTIEATRDRETHFIVEYFQISRQDRKLLQLNERRNKFVFQTTTYYCATQDDMLVDDNHFDRLADVEPLDEEVRRHPEQVVTATFERIGSREEVEGSVRYRAHIVDVLAAANIERPISEPYLRDILAGGTYPEFVADESEEDVFVYVAPAS